MIINSTDLAPLLVQLLVMSPQQSNVRHTKDRAGDSDSKASPESGGIVRRLFLDEHVTRDEVCAVAYSENNSRADSEAGSAAEVVGEPCGGHGHLDEGAAAHAEEAEVAHRS